MNNFIKFLEGYQKSGIVFDNIFSTLRDHTTKIDSLCKRVFSDEHRIYGIYIDGYNSNPETCVTYLKDAKGMTPAKMNYDTDTFDMGSWSLEEFFMPRPCMLKYNGQVDYYLDPNDYTKKADGTDSDVANIDYEGNAMMEWGRDGKKIWYKITPDPIKPKSAFIYVSDYKADEDFHAHSFVNHEGKVVDHFYTPIYNGSLDSSNRLRSMSGAASDDGTVSGRPYMQGKTGTQEISYATANGAGWYTETYGDSVLINILLVLLGKSLDTRTVFGQGNHSGYVEDSSKEYGMTPIGSMNTKGLFWGKKTSSSSDNSGVKVFGMENWYGSQWRRIAGLILNKTNMQYKLGYGTGDGSTTMEYNTTGTGYVSSGVTPSGTSGGYIDTMVYTKSGAMLPKTANGSSSTYFCNSLRFNTSQVNYAIRGGVAWSGLRVGAFGLGVAAAVSGADWSLGASLSYR